MLSYCDVENETWVLYPITVSSFSTNELYESTNHELRIRAREEGAENTSNITHLLHHSVIG